MNQVGISFKSALSPFNFENFNPRSRDISKMQKHQAIRLLSLNNFKNSARRKCFSKRRRNNVTTELSTKQNTFIRGEVCQEKYGIWAEQAWSRGLRKQLPSRQYENAGGQEIPNCINFSLKLILFVKILFLFLCELLRCGSVTAKYVPRYIYKAHGNIPARYKPPIPLPSESFRGFSRHLFRRKYLTFFQTNVLWILLSCFVYTLSDTLYIWEAFIVLRT